MAKRIFISKNESEVQELKAHYQKQNYTLIAHSFLQFEQVDFTIQHNYDVLFFSSPRSVLFFKARYELQSNKLVACTGSKTKQLLESLGVVVSFSGVNTSKINAVAEDFKSWLGDNNVLFPLSDISKKTISSLIDDAQKQEIIVYKTEIQPKKIALCDTYIFTSPSNVKGFLIANEIPTNGELISWGESTSAELRKYGVNELSELKNSSLSELYES